MCDGLRQLSGTQDTQGCESVVKINTTDKSDRSNAEKKCVGGGFFARTSQWDDNGFINKTLR